MMNTAAHEITTLTLKDAQRMAAEKLVEAGIDTAMLDARLLLARVMDMSQEAILRDPDAVIDEEAIAQLMQLAQHRANRCPMAYLLGEREFMGRMFACAQGVLIPRPDSEILVEAALAVAAEKPVKRVMDWGVGSGALMCSVLADLPQATGVGLDISPAAIKLSTYNIHALHLQNRAMVVDDAEDEMLAAPFDMILANPPYIPTADVDELMPDVQDYEPHLALDGGVDGLDAYRHVFAYCKDKLKKGGDMLVEFGMGQTADVVALAYEAGFMHQATHKDLSGIERVAHFVKP